MTAPSSAAARPLPAAVNRPVTLAALAGLMLLAALVLQAAGPRHGALVLVGALLGLTLYHAAFGFTAAWRQFLVERRSDGILAQMLMLALACALFFPALEAGQLFGRPVHGFVFPAGVSVLVGAFLFGIGMQLGGGCGSGTLYTVGGGSTRMLVTLLFFIIGSVAATAHLPWWFSLPGVGAVSLVQMLGAGPALAVHGLVFAGLALGAWLAGRGRAARTPAAGVAVAWQARLFTGPWPLLAGAIALALLNFATLALAGRPWGITSAFALWGAKGLEGLGVDMAAWPMWSRGQLDAPLTHDINSIMNAGIVLGALLAAGLAGRFAPVWRLPWRHWGAAAVGGLLLGYGARLAFGCNIGAFFSGIASGSLHGWLWLGAAVFGNLAGLALRPWFGLANHALAALAVSATPADAGPCATGRAAACPHRLAEPDRR